MNRKELLIRQNEGRREIDDYISKLSSILNTIIQRSDFIDLETTDELKQKFFEGYKTSSKIFNKTYSINEENALNNDIITLRPQFQDKEAYLITKLSEICGAVKILAIKAIDNYKSIIELDGDSLNLISINGKTCFYLDYYEEYGSFFYELSIWDFNKI